LKGVRHEGIIGIAELYKDSERNLKATKTQDLFGANALCNVDLCCARVGFSLGDLKRTGYIVYL
jgi:hypothetical protein